MTKLFLAMTAIPALAVAAPAVAQYPDDTRAEAVAEARIDRLEARLQAGIRAGTIDRREAQTLRRQLRQLAWLERRYGANGLTREERIDLRRRSRDLRQQLRVADGGAYDRYDRWDDDDDGAYAGRIDRNRDGWDDRDHDRDGRWDDDVRDGRSAGRGGPYEAGDCEVDVAAESRTGIGGLLGTLLGGGATLNVGQRVTGNLYGLPDRCRDEFRDGSGYYYRTDGRAIYQIDARSQTVIRVFPMNR